MSSEHVKFLNKPDIQDALHAKRLEYVTCSRAPYKYLRNDMYKSTKPWLEELLDNYGVMCYR